ncbi:hypothetical protein NDU88_002502 [Pleurodeles waltl]|uniref:Uncharacterized protein n=1 Tax=Pleurodeles waltl TaxID=8319 RepID=A0AAV7SD81_PLEWA|nr:hypothetical protein NDU88_002502 [Pleurodeles waltl]
MQARRCLNDDKLATQNDHRSHTTWGDLGTKRRRLTTEQTATLQASEDHTQHLVGKWHKEPKMHYNKAIISSRRILRTSLGRHKLIPTLKSAKESIKLRKEHKTLACEAKKALKVKKWLKIHNSHQE